MDIGGDNKINIQTLNPTAIREKGLKALGKALGPAGMIWFLQQYESGSGGVYERGTGTA